MSTPPVKRPTARASKDQILAAFDQLNSEYKKLASAAPVAAPASKETVVATQPETKIGSQDQGAASIEATIAALLSLRSGFGGAVSALSAKLTAEASRLTELRKEADAQIKQITDLHEITVSEDTLKNVIQDYQAKSEAFKEELTQKQEAFEESITAKTAAWTTEKEEHARAVADRDELRKKTTKRGVEEYDYDLSQRRKAEADAYEQQSKARDRELADIVQAKEKGWAEREKQVATEEAVRADFKAKFEELPQKLEAAIKKAKGEGAGIASAQSKVKADLLAKDIEGERKLFELKAKSLEAAIKERAHQIETLSSQLSTALKQGQDLAIKAIEGASNSTSFMAVKEIALEQAKNTPKSK